MNILNLISEIERVDPEVYERLDQRRQMFRHFAGFGKKLAVAAVPLAMGSMLQKAYGKPKSTGLSEQIVYVLNFALGLEYLEYYFYQMGLDAPGLLTGSARESVTIIRNDERNHVDFLRSVLGSAAIPDPGARAFDYTGSKGGKRPALFPDVFTNAGTYFAVAQAFEDTGVRAYKGGAPLLISNNTILEAALGIHSVEARHASHIRTMRRGGPQGLPGPLTSNPKSWISGDDNGGPAPMYTAPVYGPGMPAETYPSEANVTQAGVNLVTAFGVTMAEASEAFDEPLDPDTVLAIAGNFIK
ncbi:ferritin-like domain-containing protein [Hymenobacter taeanensis]|uniref:Ferritin-like domain-containing protein n=1 Tax=Hymenobacter taeanensis TaxID=2735321 RepID=A0A6M6BM54_9BACT|nr:MULTISPECIES: ferritin-like domain-containing protein [Hymenobacter]QJX48523.1 ferritin-like domain-containing protein [Hymenobacter taeanensis]UOQ81979.1 ferritin-like domain-containing protein [Hymenobacter sp. 5414T-23]